MRWFSKKSRSRTIRFLAVCSALATLSGPVWAASDEEKAAARSLAKEGLSAFQDGNHDRAVDLFSRAEALVHSPVHLLYLARAHVALGQLVRGQEAYIRIKREGLGDDAPSAFVRAQEEAVAELEKLEPRLGKLVIRIERPEGVEPSVTVDDEPVASVLLGVPMPVDPGDHVVRATADGARPVETSLTLTEGERREVDLQLEVTRKPAEAMAGGSGADAAKDEGASESSDVSTYLMYAAFGVGAVGLGAGTYFLLDSTSTQTEADSLFDTKGCASGCAEESQIRQMWVNAKNSRTYSLVGFSVGGAAVATGLVLLFTSDSDTPPSAAVTIRPEVGLGWLGASGRF